MQIDPQLFLTLVKTSGLPDADNDINLSPLIDEAEAIVLKGTDVAAVMFCPYITIHPNGLVEMDWSDTINNVGVRTFVGEVKWNTPIQWGQTIAADKIVEQTEVIADWLDSTLVPALFDWLKDKGWLYRSV